MFQELEPLIGQSAISMMVAKEGEQLRVTITQKKSAKGVPLNLSVTGTPEELDRELLGAIVSSVDAAAETKPVAEQVQAQVAAAAAVESTPAKPAKEKKATPKKKSPAPRASKPKKTPRPAATPKPKKPAAKITLPGVRADSAPKKREPQRLPRPASDAETKHHANRPDKAACIADYYASKVALGNEFNRETFIERGVHKTGRRFERLWDMSWKKFVAEAEGAEPAAPAGEDVEQSGRAVRQPRPQTPAPKKAQLDLLPDTWPFPTTPKDVEEKREKADTKNGFDAYDEKGNYLDYLGYEPELGEEVPNLGAPGTMRKVYAIDGCRVMTRAVTDSAIPPAVMAESASSVSSSGDSGPAAVADQENASSAPRDLPPRVIKNAEGVLIAGGFKRAVEKGDRLTIGRSVWVVVAFNDQQVLVEPQREEINA